MKLENIERANVLREKLNLAVITLKRLRSEINGVSIWIPEECIARVAAIFEAHIEEMKREVETL